MQRNIDCWILLVLLLLCLPQVDATAIGVNRASIQFDEVLRGGYARQTLMITTDSAEPIAGEVLVQGEAAEWLNFSARQFNFSRDRPYELQVEIMPPLDAKIERYRINMSILTGELGRSGGGMIGTSTRASLGVPIHLSMSGTERVSCQVGGITVRDTEIGQPFEVVFGIVNRGNVRINPEVSVEVFDQLQSRSLGSRATTFGRTILPTVSEQESRLFSLKLDRGQHWALVKVPLCGYEGLYTFDVLSPGEIKDDGEFVRIDAPSWANTGEIIPIKAVFRNKGVRSVRAVFKGTITRIDDGQIAKVISTDEYIVDPSVTAELETFFNPVDPGQYMVAGKVLYNEKLTGEKSAILNINGGSVVDSMSWSTVTLLAMGLIILALAVLILRKRSQHRAGR